MSKNQKLTQWVNEWAKYPRFPAGKSKPSVTILPG